MNTTSEIVLLLSIISYVVFFGEKMIASAQANKANQSKKNTPRSLTSSLLQFYNRKNGYFAATMLFGKNLSLAAIALSAAQIAFVNYPESVVSPTYKLLFLFLLLGIAIIVATELILKPVFSTKSNAKLTILAVVSLPFYIAIFPFSYLTTIISTLILKIFYGKKISISLAEKFVTKNENSNLNLDDTGNKLSTGNDDEIKFFKNALDFAEVKVRECMVPRTDIEAIEVNRSIEEITEQFAKTGFSKILVYQDSIDKVIGYFHITKLFNKPKSIKSELIPILVVPETMTAKRLLSKFIQEHKSIAVVVDEFGGTSGIVSIEDIIEEIVGEIEDEHDTDEFISKRISDDEFIFSGRIEIDYINEKYNCNIPESDEYETLAGFILYNYTHIPQANDVINIKNYKFTILEVTSTRIELVNMKIIHAE